MTGPRTKRQFAGAASDPTQRQITSFFSKASSSAASSDATSAHSQQAALNGPHLPPQVQTDLLTVGMRVRKAIPEGYKTGSTYSAFTLWDDHNNTNTSLPHHATTITASSTYSSTMRELEPFCGLNKVGGLAFQPAYHCSDEGYHTDNDAMPGLTSSQDTVSSTGSGNSAFPSTPSFSQPSHTHLNLITTATTTAITHPTRKRVLTTDEEEDHHQRHHQHQLYSGPVRLRSDGWLDSEYEGISPRSLAPPAGLWENARVLAVPRRPRQQPQQGQQQGHKVAASAAAAAAVVVMGGEGGQGRVMEEQEQENMMVVVQGDDFEEASFLDYGDLSGEGRMEIE